MYSLFDPRSPGVREKVYSQAAEFGVVCKVQDLEAVVAGLDKFLKKTKVRSQGLCKRFGLTYGIPGSRERQWSEWVMDAGAVKNNVLTAEQGLFWYFDLRPNRHFRIDEQGNAREAYIFPDRKDLAYIIFLDKKAWTAERNGQPTDSTEVRQKREAFFEALLNSVGFPLEVLHVYGGEECERIYTLSDSDSPQPEK